MKDRHFRAACGRHALDQEMTRLQLQLLDYVLDLNYLLAKQRGTFLLNLPTDVQFVNNYIKNFSVEF